MKFIAYNFVSICLIGLAAYLIYLNRTGWGWVVFAAILVAVHRAKKKSRKMLSNNFISYKFIKNETLPHSN